MRHIFVLGAVCLFSEAWALPQGTSYWTAEGRCDVACRNNGHRPETAQIVLVVRGVRLCGEIHQDYGAAYGNKSPHGKLAGSATRGTTVVGFTDSFTDPQYPGAASLHFFGNRLRWTSVMPTLVLRPDRLLFRRTSHVPRGMEKAKTERSCSEFFENSSESSVREYLERK
jgi:hypothetical protein